MTIENGCLVMITESCDPEYLGRCGKAICSAQGVNWMDYDGGPVNVGESDDWQVALYDDPFIHVLPESYMMRLDGADFDMVEVRG